MEKFKAQILAHKKLILIGGLVIIVVATIITIIFANQRSQEQIEITDVIAVSLGDDSFKIKNIPVKMDDWYLTEIASTSESDSDNPSFYLLRKDGDSFETVLGPGTSFSPEDLYAAGASDEIFRYFYGDEPVWLNTSEIYRELSANQLENTKSLLKQYASDNGVNLSKVIIKQDSLQLLTENERQTNVIYHTIFDISLNNSNSDKYTVQIDESQGVVAGTLIDSQGRVVAEKTYSIDYGR
jgi:hypothetical protein